MAWQTVKNNNMGGKTMSRYINREDLLKNLKQFAPEYLKPLIVSLIEKQPTADVAEVRHGKWQPCYEDWRKQIEGDECSACGFQHYGTNIRDYPYCPNCGARMDGNSE